MRKVISYLTKVSLVCGLIYIVGTVGASDLADSVHNCYTLTDLVKGFMIGYAMMIPYFATKIVKVK